MHTFGRSFHEQVRIMDRDFAGAPDLVARPRDEGEVAALLDWCADAGAAAIPFGGGSSVVGGVHPDVGAGFKAAVSIDMGAMDRVLRSTAPRAPPASRQGCTDRTWKTSSARTA